MGGMCRYIKDRMDERVLKCFEQMKMAIERRISGRIYRSQLHGFETVQWWSERVKTLVEQRGVNLIEDGKRSCNRRDFKVIKYRIEDRTFIELIKCP